MSEPKPKLVAFADDMWVPWCCAVAVLDGAKADREHRAACAWNEERDQIKAGEQVAVPASDVIDPSRWIGGPARD